MILGKKVIVLSFALLFFNFLDAQIELAHINTKEFTSTGFGGFVGMATPVTMGNSITAEVGFYNFKNNNHQIVLIPLVLGYRYTLNGTGKGLYVEPTAGYTIGGTDIQKGDKVNSSVVDDGLSVERKASGITSGVVAGFIFPGKGALNMGLRYQHAFVAKDPALNMLSLRISHFLCFKRRER